jgi:4-amino-4-deoxy-L-arabinose transferase-like glycosyltransferase
MQDVRRRLAGPALAWQVSLWERICFGSLLLPTLWLLLRQPLPPPWFDEGINLSAAATLARTGLYALPDATGPRVLDPAIQTGPTVLVPIAVVYKLFGIGILQARLVIVAFGLLAFCAYWLLARRLIGPWLAGLALLFLLAGTPDPYANFLGVSRQALGEIPALAYLLLGLLIWLKAIERRSTSLAPLIFSGVAWGIAMLTKSQVMLTFPAALAVLAVLDRLYYRQASWRAFLLPGLAAAGCVAAWYLAQLLIAGPELFRQNAAVLQEGSQIHLLGLNPAHWRNAIGSIWRTHFWLWGPPALLWAFVQARRPSFSGFHHGALLCIVGVMLGWFVILSIGWARYLFFPLMLTPIWLAGLLGSIASASSVPHGLSRPLAVMLAVLFLLGNGRYQVRALSLPADNGYVAMRDYLASEAPADALIETWEWELSIEARQPIHHPPTAVTNANTAYVMSRRTPPPELYDPLQANPDYILVGPYNSYSGAYTAAVEAYGEEVAAFGAYTLFKIRAPGATGEWQPVTALQSSQALLLTACYPRPLRSPA